MPTAPRTGVDACQSINQSTRHPPAPGAVAFVAWLPIAGQPLAVLPDLGTKLFPWKPNKTYNISLIMYVHVKQHMTSLGLGR